MAAATKNNIGEGIAVVLTTTPSPSAAVRPFGSAHDGRGDRPTIL